MDLSLFRGEITVVFSLQFTLEKKSFEAMFYLIYLFIYLFIPFQSKRDTQVKVNK